MIFVTVGSHPTYRFQRLLDALETLGSEDLVVQHGPGEPPRSTSEARAWLSYDEMLRYMEQASTIITHVGVGTILTASNLGHVPIVVPRLRRFGETVDDHQLELATVLERTGQVVVAWDADELPVLVADRRSTAERSSRERHMLRTAVRDALVASSR